VISVLSPDRIIHVTWSKERGVSELSELDGRSLDAKRALLRDLGVSFSDVFGNELVIWVEGETERQCFDLILDGVSGGRPTGVVFLAMPFASKVDTRTANKSKAIEAFFDLHARVSSGAVLYPAEARFSFDGELRSDEKRREIEKRSGERARFLPRRMYENYLCHPQAIAAVLTCEDTSRGYDASDVSAWIESHCADYMGDEGEVPEASRDAARLLKDLFLQITEYRIEYDKVRHGKLLTRWLIASDLAYIGELTRYVHGLAAR
jgi:hypothetical protein